MTELPKLPRRSVQCVVTSPPYFNLRTYGDHILEIGREPGVDAYIATLVAVFEAIRPVLKDDGVVWLNIGDSFASKPLPASSTFPAVKKGEQILLPAMLALELRRAGWYVQQDVIWHKKNPMPSSTKRRCVPSHEYVWLVTKQPEYAFDVTAIEEEATCASWPGIGGRKQASGQNSAYSGRVVESNGKRRKRDVWTAATSKCKDAHFAPFPESIVLPCVLAGSKPGDTVLDPFSGTGTTGRVCASTGRRYIGIELYKKFVDMHM